MYQQPSASRIVGESPHDAATSSSNVNRPQNNSHLTSNLSIGSIHSPHYRLPPPPSYYGPHLIDNVGQIEPKFLSNWCVTVKSIKLEQGDSSLTAALSGTLLENDRQTISCENYDAGRLVFVISKDIVKTNDGVYHLLGPIAQGYPNNLYRACLEAGGIPRTWKYVLTQFSGRLPGGIQRTISTADDAAVVHSIGIRIQELIRSFKILRRLAIIADKRLKEHSNARKSISFVRHHFQQKLAYSLRIINNQIIMVQWVEKHDCVLQFFTRLSSIIEALDKISDWDDINTATKATYLSKLSSSGEFILTLITV
eukprot:XP_016661150.1 PREDICTED: uncharacterized protein LOC107884139 [Acyrthosiphon pisum]